MKYDLDYGVKVEEMTLTAKNGTSVDLWRHSVSVQIYQSIFQPFMFVEIIVLDPQDIDENVNYQGGETLVISFAVGKSPQYNFQKEFELYSIANKTDFVDSESGKQRGYTLRFFDLGWRTFYSNRISKFYENLTIPEIVEQHVQEQANITLKGKTNSDDRLTLFAMPYWNCNTLIKYLQRKCESFAGIGAFGQQVPKDVGYLFFENNDGHYFVTLSDMCSQLANSGNRMVLYHSIDAVTESGDNMDFAIKVNWINNINIFKNYTANLFGAQMNYFDIKNGTCETQDYKMKEYLDTTMTLGQWTPWNQEFVDQGNQPELVPILCKPSFYEDIKNSGVNDFMWHQKMKLMQTHKLEGLTPMNLKIMAGKTINYNVKGYDRSNNEPVLSGTYLITDVIYHFQQDSAFTRFSMVKETFSDMETKTVQIGGPTNL